MKRRKIIGAKVRLLCDIQNRGGIKFHKGEIGEIYGSYNGYSIQFSDNRAITRVEKHKVVFIEEEQ